MMPHSERHLIFKKYLEHMSSVALELAGTPSFYSDEDLINASLILSEVVLSKTHDHHASKLNQKQMERLAEELGTSLRQTILLFTGVDLHKAVAESLK